MESTPIDMRTRPGAVTRKMTDNLANPTTPENPPANNMASSKTSKETQPEPKTLSANPNAALGQRNENGGGIQKMTTPGAANPGTSNMNISYAPDGAMIFSAKNVVPPPAPAQNAVDLAALNACDASNAHATAVFTAASTSGGPGVGPANNFTATQPAQNASSSCSNSGSMGGNIAPTASSGGSVSSRTQFYNNLLGARVGPTIPVQSTLLARKPRSKSTGSFSSNDVTPDQQTSETIVPANTVAFTNAHGAPPAIDNILNDPNASHNSGINDGISNMSAAMYINDM